MWRDLGHQLTTGALALTLAAAAGCDGRAGAIRRPADASPAGDEFASRLTTWRVDSTVSPVDGATTIRLSLSGVTAGQFGADVEAPGLFLVCERGQVRVQFVSLLWTAYEIAPGRAAVRWRFSRDTAKADTWYRRPDGLVIGPDDQRGFADQLAHSDSLHIDVAGSGAGKGITSFALSGLRAALGRHAADCLTHGET